MPYFSLERMLSNWVMGVDTYISRAIRYFQQNAMLTVVFCGIVIAAYGYELFNLNLTIDEEVHANSSQALSWIEQGRWGMYLLNSYLLPQPVIPFVPLFTALVFHFLSILLLMSSWQVTSKLDRLIAGGLALSFPGMAYMYTFSSINYGVGIGLFLVALSLFVYARADGRGKYYAIFPAALSLSIYQGFAVALAVAFLVHFIADEMNSGRRNVSFKNLLTIFLIGIFSASAYYLVQKMFLLFTATSIGYVDTFFDIGYLLDHFSEVARNVVRTAIQVYSGASSVYGVDIPFLAIITPLAILCFYMRLRLCALSFPSKCLLLCLFMLLVILPFLAGFLTKGHLAMRFLVALPIFLAGLLVLALTERSKGGRLLIGTLAAVCVFQFVVTTNTLFSSSALALEADRVLATRLMERIAEAKSLSTSRDVRYLEVVGYVQRPPTRLVLKSETFGASFFEWDQGNIYRILMFMNTLGFYDLQAMPGEERGGVMSAAEEMPAWPDKGSVKVIGDTVVVKFGTYSEVQVNQICSAGLNSAYCK